MLRGGKPKKLPTLNNRKLNVNDSTQLIHTVRGAGYILSVEW